MLMTIYFTFFQTYSHWVCKRTSRAKRPQNHLPRGFHLLVRRLQSRPGSRARPGHAERPRMDGFEAAVQGALEIQHVYLKVRTSTTFFNTYFHNGCFVVVLYTGVPLLPIPRSTHLPALKKYR